MSDFDEQKTKVKKLSARAMQLKMDLHDLSEELPLNWEIIPALAKKTYDAFAELADARAQLKTLQEQQAGEG